MCRALALHSLALLYCTVTSSLQTPIKLLVTGNAQVCQFLICAPTRTCKGRRDAALYRPLSPTSQWSRPPARPCRWVASRWRRALLRCRRLAATQRHSQRHHRQPPSRSQRHCQHRLHQEQHLHHRAHHRGLPRWLRQLRGRRRRQSHLQHLLRNRLLHNRLLLRKRPRFHPYRYFRSRLLLPRRR